LVLLENCGFGTSITKACAAQLAELVGKESSEFSKYTVYQPGKPRSTRSYLRLGSKNENTNEIITKVKKQFKKGELIIFPKTVIHTCRLNKNEMGQLASLIETSLSHEKPVNEDEEKSKQQEPEMTRSAEPTQQPMIIGILFGRRAMYHQVDNRLLNTSQFGRPGGKCPMRQSPRCSITLPCR
jgi:hypothetical protein